MIIIHKILLQVPENCQSVAENTQISVTCGEGGREVKMDN